MTVETARRHGNSDPRFLARGRLRLVVDDDALDEEREPAMQGPPPGPTEAQDDSVSSWEDEGGLHAVADPAAEEKPPALDWYAFQESFFPGRRRHDFVAVKAYAAYRATGLVPAAVAAVH